MKQSTYSVAEFGALLGQQRAGYSVAEVGILLGICDQSVYNLLNAGRLKSYKLGRRRIIPADEIVRLQSEAV